MEPRREQSRAQHMGKAGRILNPNVFDSLRVMTMIPPMMSPWMTPAQGNPMLRPQQVPTKLIPGCAVTSHPRGCAVSTLHRKVPSHSHGDCLLCMVEYVSGQVTCTTCGYEPLPVDESGEIKRQPNRRTKVLEKRMKKLAEFGMNLVCSEKSTPRY